MQQHHIYNLLDCRCAVEAARQLDEKQRRVQSCLELFQPDLIARRLRLAELCERLALSQPAIYGKKAEEILWRKGYYEVLTVAKSFKKVMVKYTVVHVANK
jgi:protein SMG5